MASNEQPSSPLTRVTQVFGLFAGAAVLVYITGGVVLALRLGFENLPFEAVIGQLPREFLISQGLTTVVLPAAAGAALYAIYRLIRQEHKQPKLKRLSFTGDVSKWWKLEFWWSVLKFVFHGWKVLFVAAVASFVLILPAVVHELIKDGWRDGMFWFLVAFVLTLLNTITVLQVRAMLAEKHFRWAEDASGWNNERVVAVMAALYAAAIVPGAITFGATLPLLDAKVCRATGAEEVGSLIGETSDKVYVGLGEHTDGDREIVVFPFDQVRQVFAGGHAKKKDAACPTQEAKGSEGAPSSGTRGPTGATGATGPRGRDGSQGTRGPTGRRGQRGPPAADDP